MFATGSGIDQTIEVTALISGRCIGCTLSTSHILVDMDFRLRGNDTGSKAHLHCHSREGGNPCCLLYCKLTK